MIPELPKHERFSTNNDTPEFKAYGRWAAIDDLVGDSLEEACCIARCWHLDQAADSTDEFIRLCMDDNADPAEVQKMDEFRQKHDFLAEAWRDYYNERIHQ